MSKYKHYTVFFNIDSEEYTEQAKLNAIKNVIGMPTHNGVNKESIIKAFRWMYDFAFEEATKPQTNADRIRAMSDEELAEFLECVESAGYNDSSITPRMENGFPMDMLQWLKSEAKG